MSTPGRQGPARRRSSVAYDPARDTFKEIPASVPENAVVDGPPSSDNAVVSSPTQEELSVAARNKRKRSPSPQARTPGEPQAKRSDAGKTDSKRHQSSLESSSPKSRPPSSHQTTKPQSVSDLPRVPRRDREEGEVNSPGPDTSAYSRRPDSGRPQQHGRPSRRSQSPNRRTNDVYRRRSPPRRRERTRSPSPIRRSPPREQVHRPGGARGRGRNVLVEQQRLAAEREAKQSTTGAKRGVQDASNQFYNARPEWVKERGREWRKNESQIKGLRSFNNWIKSCLIQKFSPEEKTEPEELGWGEEAKAPEQLKPLLVLDIGCGKGGDLGKWQLAPQPVDLYVGLDPADTSIRQAQDRYDGMRRGRRPIFDARFITKDCFGEWIGEVPIVGQVGIDSKVGSGVISRFGGGGFDVVAMMFSMHYAFESEEKVRMMLRNVAGSLKKGGRFIGVAPNSDSLADSIRNWFKTNPQVQAKQQPEGEANGQVGGQTSDEGPCWGNSLYNVRFPSSSTPALTPAPDGTIQFRPPVGWKYTYWMAEAVDVPEFVVPWEAFRAIAESFNLEQRYRKPFLEIWDQEGREREMTHLAQRMGVIDERTGEMRMSEQEREAVGFYHGFCFVKV